MSEPHFKSTKKIIGIQGTGRFGTLLAEIFSQQLPSSKFEVVVFSRSKPSNKAINEVDIWIPCVPMSQFTVNLTQISAHLKPGALVMDVCSVKVFPIEEMMRILPKNIQIIGTHPVFGPDSINKNQGLTDLPIVLTRVRATNQTWQMINELFSALKLKLIHLSAEEHDQFAAFSQAYAFLIGKISQRMQIQSTPIDTMWYKLLIEERNAVEHDTEELFFDIQRKNPFAHQMRLQFSEVVTDLLAEIKGQI